jgi:alginate O-acetyltransferase complex protein AlgI
MLFSSPSFFAFFAVYFLFHLSVPKAYRIFLIIIGSTVFYGWWKLEYVWLPYLLTMTAYLAVLWIESTDDALRCKRRLIASVAILFMPLIFFKYTDFIYRDVFGPVFGLRDKVVDLPLPLGVSFITFTLTAYVVDVYRDRFKPDRSLKTVTGYVLFFPHLIAGPILRPHELIPQLDRPRPALSPPFTLGCAIFTMGLVKKLVFADQIAPVVDRIYALAGMPGGPEAVLAIYGFSMQIYCDFSGYTDMAIGLAILLGVRLPNNFRCPYCAVSLIDFWRRWNMTLSFWLRDYLYIPLGGNRHGTVRTCRNIILTMVLGGLWHGASWTFVVWGFLHGIGVSFVHLVRTHAGLAGLRRIPNWLAVLITFHFVTIAWVFFRAPTLGRALHILAAPFVANWGNVPAFLAAQVPALLLLSVFLLLHRYDDHRRIMVAVRRCSPQVIWPAMAVLWCLAITLSQGSSAKFIYFEF